MILPRRQLGSTDLAISALGLGTVKFGRNTDVKYPQAFTIPDDKAAANLLAVAQDLNINMLDTAPAYGNSEERLGKLLRGQRHNWIIVGKAGENYIAQQSHHDFTRDAVLNSIKRSLRNLNTDYLDVVLIHSDGNDAEIISQYGVFDTLNIAKQQGLIRYSGMSTKTVAGGLLTLQHSDVAMIMLNPNATEEAPVAAAAQELNKGILIKKAFASGHLDKLGSQDPIQTTMDFIFAQPGVGSIILGTINHEHLRSNVQSAVAALTTKY